MNAFMRQKAKNNFEKNYFRSMNNVVFGKAMGNVRKHRDVFSQNLSQQNGEETI